MNTSSAHSINLPIDVVIAWVDGSDPVLNEKRMNFFMGEKHTNSSGARPTRFASNNEIKYCILSIMKFAPFVRNIFIVTDGQDPIVYEDVSRYFPERLNSIRIVDHKEIFKGYEKYLPTFNSTSIETMIWRIEGLSENFVYFNDDFFLVRGVQPEDWFVNNSPVLRGKWMIAPIKKVIKNKILRAYHKFFLNSEYQVKFSFYVGQWNAAKLLGRKFTYFFNCHTPYVFNKKVFEQYFKDNQPVMLKNISYRFRNQDQFNLTTLANHLEIIEGNRNFAKINRGYIVPSYYSRKQLIKRMKRCEVDPNIKSVCVQSLDTASKEEQDMIFAWMDKILNLSTS